MVSGVFIYVWDGLAFDTHIQGYTSHLLDMSSKALVLNIGSNIQQSVGNDGFKSKCPVKQREFFA